MSTAFEFLNECRFRGARVVVGMDGGRLRTRKQKRGRRRKTTGHHGFYSRWREHKMFVFIPSMPKDDAVSVWVLLKVPSGG